MRVAVIIICFFLGSGSFSFAQDEAGSSRGHIRPYGGGDYYGWSGYLDISAGYSNYNRNLDVEGAPSSFKILGSYLLPEATMVFDLGYGVLYQSFSQKAAVDSSISTSVMELAARYPFENRVQLGAVYNQLFNKGENYGANQADVEFLGIQLLREFNMSSNTRGRLGMRIVTSINVVNESVNMAFLDFQMGWGGAERSTDVASE